MKLCTVYCTLIALCTVSALSLDAKGLLPSMVYRFGLTNEQIDKILEKHPDAQLRITAQDWRAMKYQLHRFDCMTNYVNIIGSTQDCERVLLQLHDRGETLASSNAVLGKLVRNLRASADAWEASANEWYAYSTNALAVAEDATNRLAVVAADYMSASNRAARAEARTNALIAWAEEQRDKAILSTTKAIWQQFIDRLKQEDN